MSDAGLKNVARRWFDAINTGDLRVLDEIVAEDVVDHSGLSTGHGYGREGHRKLSAQLRNVFPGWQWRIDDIKVNDDIVEIDSTGKGPAVAGLQELVGQGTAVAEPAEFHIKSCVRIRNGKIVEHWAMQGPVGKKGTPGDWSGGWKSPASAEELKDIARRWFDAINSGDLGLLDRIVAENVTDHSGLSSGHGYGREGHKKLSAQLRSTFPGWQWRIDHMAAKGDLVMIDSTGKGPPPTGFQSLVGQKSAEATPMELRIRSCVRISNGMIVEHWAMQGPVGKTGGPSEWDTAPYPTGDTPPTSSTAANKEFMQRYVRYVIDGQNPALAARYFAPNFYNHDRAPGEELGLNGVTKFLQAIFSAFSGFQTTIEEQVAQDDLVVGRWSQNFTNTGPYLSFPATGRDIHITGMTITRVRNGQIIEEWEGRDAVGLLVQMGVVQPLGALEGDDKSAAGVFDRDNEAIARHYFYEGWNGGDLAVVDESVAADFVNRIPMRGQSAGPQGLKQLIKAWRNGFPDLSVVIDLVVSEGQKVAVRWTLRGTHRGTFLTIPPTGKTVMIPGITLFRIENGKIKECWEHWEQAGMLMQLGLVQFPEYPPGGPSPGGSPPTPPAPNW